MQAQQKGPGQPEPSLRAVLPHKVIITDGTRLRQILWNLISNAVKLAPAGWSGWNVRVRYDEGDILHFEVEDSGNWYSWKRNRQNFRHKYQVKDSHGGKPATGTGIGLAVSRRLARNMGG
ncbi:ATP-binding protein [Klebsiella pneumoniae]|nr:ATP-binding protein [Klebsiella pneumoniae]